MSGENQDKLKLDQATITDVNKRLIGTRRRMEELSNVQSLRKGRDAHKLIGKSRDRIEAAIKLYETDAKAKGVAHEHRSRAIVAGMAQAYNALDSLCDGFDEGDISQKELLDAGSHVSHILKGVRTMIKANVDTGVRKMDAADTFLAANESKTKVNWTHDNIDEDEDEDAKDDAKRARKDLQQQKHYDGINDLFKRNASHESKLPNARKDSDEFVILKLPVYPQMAKPASKEQFNEAGLKVGGNDGFYIQLEDQLLLGVNTSKLKEQKQKLHKYVQHIVSVISQKRGQVFHVIGSDDHDLTGAGREIQGGKSPGFVYYWLMPDRDLSKLTRVLQRSNNSFDVDDWGVAIGAPPTDWRKRSENVDRLRKLREGQG